MINTFIIQQINMEPVDKTIVLQPWIYIQRHQNTLLTKINLKRLGQVKSDQFSLITILSTRQEALSLIGNIQIIKQESLQTLVYLSNQFRLNQQNIRIAYFPYNQVKISNECVQSLTQILKIFSEIVFSDVNCSQIHRKKVKLPKIHTELKQFIVVNGVQIYQIESKDNKIQFLKKIQTQKQQNTLFLPYFAMDLKNKINKDLIEKIMTDCLQECGLYLNCQKSWNVFALFIIYKYKAQIWLQQHYKKHNNKLILSIQQFDQMKKQFIRQEGDIDIAINLIINKIFNNLLSTKSKDNTQQLISQLQQSFSKDTFTSVVQLRERRDHHKQLLKLYQISVHFIDFITILQQRFLYQSQIASLKQQNKTLRTNSCSKQSQFFEIILKYRQSIGLAEQLEKKLRSNSQLLQKLEIENREFEKEKEKCWKLKVELDSHLQIENKNTKIMNELNLKLQNLMVQKEGLLSGLEEMTSQNLGLMNQKEQLIQKLQILEDKLSETDQIEARALKSIENQIEIQARLERYQNYVRELKQSMKSFKRIQVQKFNYILSHNYKQYEQLEERYKFTQFQLKRSQHKCKQFQDILHCERLRIAYFQKIFINNIQNEPIPEVSEENSQTDRENVG